MSKKKIAIIGASDFQNPLIVKAKDMGLETHVFAWEDGSIGERNADYFHPISITEIDEIADACRKIGVSGICSIGTDLGNITVSKVAEKLGLCANSVACVNRSTNKHLMRETFFANGDPSPWSIQVHDVSELDGRDLAYPIIVKPVDRSGSRAITRLENSDGLSDAVSSAIEVSFAKAAVVEEFFEGTEYSVEYVSWKGEHHFLALTRKFTTGAPKFIETGHIEPAVVSSELLDRVKAVISHALDGLGVEYGASHSEILINESGDIRIVEIGSRMGGDCIGSDLVELSTGIDFLRAVVDVSLGNQPDLEPCSHPGNAMIRFVFGDDDLVALERAKNEFKGAVEKVVLTNSAPHEIVDSGSRYGFFILSSVNRDELAPYLPEREA
ncbi:ATP-grasp domain-containing protein [Parolsenella sp. LCP21S3_E11]|uniref:ATP-grasp domain-containing protein n=1 Tax=Parolsenella sp. LCP21S3_E11 TaxID=3438797 RepID=UPI003F948772